MPISIYLVEAILHISQLVSKDQSSPILERMPTSFSNVSRPNTTQIFPFYWAHRALMMIFVTIIVFQKTTIFSLDSAAAVSGSICYHYKVFMF